MNHSKAGIYPKHFMEYIIKPTLEYFEMDSMSAQQLMICTAAVESRLGRYLKQLKGPALGPYQCEPDTHDGHYKNWLNFRPELKAKFDVLASAKDYKLRKFEQCWSFGYATAIARLKYWRVDELLPEHGDIEGMAVYWKNHYNTGGGKGTVDEFIRVYHKYIEGQL